MYYRARCEVLIYDHWHSECIAEIPIVLPDVRWSESGPHNVTVTHLTVSVVLALPTSKDVCVPVSDIAARSSLRSAERGDLFVPGTRTMKLSRRSFTVAAPVVWNSLPAHLRSPLISRGQIRAGLKTHLFKQAYSL